MYFNDYIKCMNQLDDSINVLKVRGKKVEPYLWLFTPLKGRAMRQSSGDQFLMYVAFAGAILVVLCLMLPGYSLQNTMDSIISFWDYVLNRPG